MQPVPETIERLLASGETVTSGEVAHVAGVTRQAAHHHLRAMTQSGLLIREGAGRGTRYRRATTLARRHPLQGLEEDVVWNEDVETLQGLRPAVFTNPNVRSILHWAFTAMLNNAVDHSLGSTVRVGWLADSSSVSFEVEDDGIGVFRNVRESRGLNDDFEAIGEVAKGKQTTAPERHSGMGIFFTSKMVDKFTLSSGHLAWKVDAALADQAVGWLDKERAGTLVRCEVDRATMRRARGVFDTFSDPETLEFSKSAVRISLFHEGGRSFVSRSEAKRLTSRLENFAVVELDFSDVDELGQGFVDEVFRVWANRHPETQLVLRHANPAIVAMITGAKTGATGTSSPAT